MSDDDAFKMNTKGLDGILKALKNNMYRARVGILGSKTVRSQVPKQAVYKSLDANKKPPKGKFDATTNASLGALHEFGSSKMPIRSFLRVPIAEHLQANLENSNAFSKEALEQVVRDGWFVPWLEKIAIVAEKIVAEAFASNGFGKWPAWKTKGYQNNTGQILVDTQQLRNSITSEVK